jgi:dihydropyrimidinase
MSTLAPSLKPAYIRIEKIDMDVDLVVSGGTIVSGAGYRRADVAIAGTKIVEVAPDLSQLEAERRIDASGRFILPGLFDAHNHPYYDENLQHFSRAAAYGGITTLVPFVSGSSMAGGVIRDVKDAAREFIDEVATTSYLDCGGHAILSGRDVEDGSIAALRSLGFNSFKVFLAFPGVRMLTDDQVFDTMRQVKAAGGICMVHCENGPVTDLLEREFRASGRTTGHDYLASRPAELENESVYRVLSLATIADCPVYVVHLSSSESLNVVESFRRRERITVFAETCTHYLTLTGEDQVALGTKAKVSPPFRESSDIDGLWEGLVSGSINVLATDTSGQLLSKKMAAGDDYFAAPYGVPGVEEFVRVIVAEATRRGFDPLPLMARSMAEQPASIFGLADRKGSIEVGKDADLAIFAPDSRWVIRSRDQHGLSDFSLYEGLSGVGEVVWTCQRGRVVLEDGSVRATPGQGIFLPAN